MIDRYDFSPFDKTQHMLNWLHPSVEEAIKQEFSNILNQQVPGSELLGLHVTSDPDWLTGAIPRKDDDSKAILARVGVAFCFALSVKSSEGEVHDLNGVYTWVSVNMNEPERIEQKTWMDLNGDLSEFGSNGYLKERIYFNLTE